MQFRSVACASLVVTASALCVVGVGCQNPDAFLRDGGAMTTGTGGRFGTGTGGMAGMTQTTGKGGGAGGGTFTGQGGSTGRGGGGGSVADSGAGGGGGTPPMPCTTCQIGIEYTCRSMDTQTISFVVRVVNNGGTPVAFSNITIRYWFTADTITPVVNCDYASIHDQQGSCADVLSMPPAPALSTFHTVSPALPTADRYLEIVFDAGAGMLDGFHSNMNDQIQLRIHDENYKNMMQTNDYSFNCSMLNKEVESQLITAYIGGVLKFGTEPGGTSSAGDAGSTD